VNGLDWAVIAAYVLVVIGIGVALSRFQNTLSDYYLAGNRMRWWQSGLSTMATQLSAISFVSVPAFVALEENGGMKWLTLEFALPIGLIVVMAVIVPVFHRRRFISIYEYLEERFDRGTRSLVSFLFLLSRGLATGIVVLEGAVVLSAALGIGTVPCILLVGLITVLYDVLGGIGVVVLSDVLQMGIIGVAIGLCGWAALGHVGPAEALGAFETARFQIFHGGFGLGGEPFAFLPVFFGGLFLYMAYYGCDQSQVQRELTVGDVPAVRKSLLINVFGRFPLVVMYCFVGILVGAIMLQPEGVETVARATGHSAGEVRSLLRQREDRMLPMFIVGYLPHGLIGFVFAGVLSALMSSLDSAINSLSASTFRDFYQPYVAGSDREAAHDVWVSRGITVMWGLFCVGAALYFQTADETLVELINQLGSLFYGPILAAFLLGMAGGWAGGADTRRGVLAGILLNVTLWKLTPVSWLWWSLTGFAGTVAAAAFSAILGGRAAGAAPVRRPPAVQAREDEGSWARVYAGCVLYTGVVLAVSYGIETLPAWGVA